jgi:hypothetical protein
LPARLFWSGPDPRAVRWDLADPGRRRDLYEIILVEGTLEDIQRLVTVTLWLNSGTRCTSHRGYARPGDH